ncbi:MAG: cobalt ECF transporter T component CbiQ [Actinomycetia bacterium]|nr:cobalt ECF transporter T component CbiQ [Actinomycetes bacterium]
MTHEFLDVYSDVNSFIHRLEPRIKIVLFFSIIIFCVTTPADSFATFLIYLAVLSVLWFLSKIPVLHVLKRVVLIVPFVLCIAIFIPFFKPDIVGGGYNLGNIHISSSGLLVLWNVMIKSFTSIISIILLSSTTPFPELLKGLEKLKTPTLLINMVSFMYRYSFVFMEEARRMKNARDSRNFGGKWLWHSNVIAHMIGTLFLRSYERAERTYFAMLSRGYSGEIRVLHESKIKPTDFVFLVFILALLAALRIAILLSGGIN